MQKISFTVAGQKLNGSLFYPEKLNPKNPAVLFLHGWRSGEKSSYGRAEALVKLGFICMSFNMRGHGTSDGDIQKQTREDFLQDIIAAYDYLAHIAEVDDQQITVIGASFGGYMAALLSRERKIKNIVMRVPANYPDESFDKPQINFSGDNNPDVLLWRFKSLSKEETLAQVALAQFPGKILIIESEKDELVPHQTIENYINAVKDKSQITHVVMKDADHAMRDEKFRVEYDHILTEWFSNNA